MVEEADEARRLAEEWEAKYKVGKGFKSWYRRLTRPGGWQRSGRPSTR